MLHDCRRLLSAAAADYDLTGQILWPAARLLADYLAAHPQLLEGRRGACELGAGLGLAGLTASRVCCARHLLVFAATCLLRGVLKLTNRCLVADRSSDQIRNKRDGTSLLITDVRWPR